MSIRREVRCSTSKLSRFDGRTRPPEWEPEPLPLPISLPYDDGSLGDVSRSDEPAEPDGIDDDPPRHTPGVIVIDLL